MNNNLLLLARKVPNAPAHILESGAALPGVAGGDHLDPRAVQVRLIYTRHHLLHKVLGGIKMPRLPQIHRRRLLIIFPRSPTVQYGLQVPINPLIASHLLSLSHLLSSKRQSGSFLYRNHISKHYIPNMQKASLVFSSFPGDFPNKQTWVFLIIVFTIIRGRISLKHELHTSMDFVVNEKGF
jgi:hypothetical protein